jgi:hypothetical protein
MLVFVEKARAVGIDRIGEIFAARVTSHPAVPGFSRCIAPLPGEPVNKWHRAVSPTALGATKCGSGSFRLASAKQFPNADSGSDENTGRDQWLTTDDAGRLFYQTVDCLPLMTGGPRFT